MIARAAAAAALALAACGPPSGGPALRPEQDVTVVYRHKLEPSGSLGPETAKAGRVESVLTLRAAADGRMRTDQRLVSVGGGLPPPERRGRSSVALFHPTGAGYRAIFPNEDWRAAWESTPPDDGFRVPPGGRKIGSDSVAGVACDVWRYESDKLDVEGCYAPDGVMLRYRYDERVAVASFEATRVDHAPIDLTLLELPAGWPITEAGSSDRVPTLGELTAAEPTDLLRACDDGDAACAEAQAGFVAAWPQAHQGDRPALALVARCLTRNCEGAVRIYPPVGCVFALVAARREGTELDPNCWRDLTVPQQSFMLDASKDLYRRLFREEMPKPR